MSTLLLLLLIVIVEANPTPKQVVRQNATAKSSTSSPWLKNITNPRAPGCRNRPWICNQGEFRPRIRRLCCRNRCVDVTSDVYNCGLCGIRCPFTWQCCSGLCIDTNSNHFHCGKCENRCPFRSLCFYGMCGYAQPLPPFPFPPKPPHPPHFPFPPKQPKPPHPPYGPHQLKGDDQPPPMSWKFFS
ncbi:hypothetical protein L1049_000926 [Liquidambar formosana]|uniref:Stigma-specific Stig1 family protein n=1 Tax=Liquidambar formosana TaxID=63359 RepID=A0AAP0R3L0_LIQFO